jgi:hypothetical protein
VVAGAFVEEYFAHVPKSWRSRLPLHYGSLLVKKAAVKARRNSPGERRHQVDGLLEEARNTLADRIGVQTRYSEPRKS